MHSLQLQNDTLIDIATFLARRWSGKENVIVGFSKIRQNETRLKEKKVLLMPNEHYYGNDFQKYRQFRVSIWYEAMRLKHCEKILSNDHAYGFILNAIETRRIELVGIKVWKGMVEELIFNYTNMWLSRANLGSIFGKARTVEAFYQYFLFGDIKGEIQPSQFNKVTKAVELAKHILGESMEKDHGTSWIESKIPEILKILDEVKIKDDLVMIDHINKETVDLIDRDVYVGLTVQPPLKISHEEAAEIIKNYDKKFILSSDLGSLKADIYALPRTKLYMKKIGVDEDKIIASTYKNAKEFYRL